jgi:hypothetical protein
MEEKQVITATSTYRKQSSMNGGYFGKDIQNAGGMPAASFMGGVGAFDTGSEPPDDKEERKQMQYFRQEDDFLYGQISGSKLQEFRVLKSNRKGKFQERTLCIDGSSFYHKKLGRGGAFSIKSLLPGNLLNSNTPKLKPIS